METALSYEDNLQYIQSTIARHLRHGAKLTQEDLALADVLASLQAKLDNANQRLSPTDSLSNDEQSSSSTVLRNAVCDDVAKQFRGFFRRHPFYTFDAPPIAVIHDMLTSCFSDHIDKLAKVCTFNSSRSTLSVPYVTLNLPVRMIKLFHNMSSTTPGIKTCLTHSDYGVEFLKMVMLCDRYAFYRIVCNLVYSVVDRTFIFLDGTKNEYCPVCAQSDCDRSAPVRCSGCRTTAYCSETCQRQDWHSHKRVCQKFAEIVEEFHVFQFRL